MRKLSIIYHQTLSKIEFIYSIDEIQNSIDNSLIIGPTNSKDLFDLPNKLGENTFTISLSNDFSVMNKYADNEIIFVFSSPYQHVEILGDYINSSNSLGVLYKQNEYGLKLFEYFKDTYPLKYIKSSPFGDSAVDLELSVKLMGDLNTYDNIIIFDDTLRYKDLLGYLATKDGTYPLERVYLIDNFFWEGTNQRADSFGGSIDKRTAFACEIVKRARAKVGTDFPMAIRFSQWKQQDFDAKLAYTEEDLKTFLMPLVDAGIDMFHASNRRYWEPEFEGSNLNLAGWTK